MARKKKSVYDDPTTEAPVTEEGGDPVMTELVSVPELPAPVRDPVEVAYERWASSLSETVPAWKDLTPQERQGFHHAAFTLVAGRTPSSHFDICFLGKE